MKIIQDYHAVQYTPHITELFTIIQKKKTIQKLC